MLPNCGIQLRIQMRNEELNVLAKAVLQNWQMLLEKDIQLLEADFQELRKLQNFLVQVRVFFNICS